MQKIYKIIIASIFILFVFFTLLVVKHLVFDSKSQDSYVGTINVSVMVGSQKLDLAPSFGASLYDALLSAQKKGQLELKGENYPGLGFFVTKIGPLENGGGKYLFYYINGQEASVGVSSYILHDGDVVLWKLK